MPPSTSPMTLATSDSPGRSRLLSTMASGALIRLASPARAHHAADVRRDHDHFAKIETLPMSRIITGEANRLSVGISKKPWIWPA